MTKKDFKLIADVIKSAKNNNPETEFRDRKTYDRTLVDLTNDFANRLIQTNQLFDRIKFVAACGFESQQ